MVVMDIHYYCIRFPRACSQARNGVARDIEFLHTINVLKIYVSSLQNIVHRISLEDHVDYCAT